MGKKHIGSSFDEILKDIGIFEEVVGVSSKRVYLFQLQKEMERMNINKSQLAKKMGTSRAQVERILDVKHSSTLSTLSRAAEVVEKKVSLILV